MCSSASQGIQLGLHRHEGVIADFGDLGAQNLLALIGFIVAPFVFEPAQFTVNLMDMPKAFA